MLYAPFFFDLRISRASGSYPGAIIPSETSRLIILAVVTSHTSERAIQSPKDDIRSVPLALAYAQARGESSRPSMSLTKHIFFMSSSSLKPRAAEVGETCLNEVAQVIPVASFSSFTSCQLLNASRKLIYPGLPLSISIGRSEPFFMYIFAGFWLGLHPYFNSNSFISVYLSGLFIVSENGYLRECAC